jgi:anti-anti-sigma regulatory factor
MPKIIGLPSYLTLDRISELTPSILTSNGMPNACEVDVDFQHLIFIDGSGLTGLYNALAWLQSHGVVIRFTGLGSFERQAIKYLDDCGFFAHFLGSALAPQAQRRQSMIPCQQIAHCEAHNWLERAFSPWIADILCVSHGSLGSLRAAIKEIFHNISDHSTLSFGFIHAQHYPKSKEIAITVSDFGTGIPRNARVKNPALTDDDAIILAAQLGFTTKSKPNNMGVGLDFLIQSVTSNSGTMTIYSYHGIVGYSRSSQGGIATSKALSQSPYLGTLIDIRFPTLGFVGDDEDEGEYTW